MFGHFPPENQPMEFQDFTLTLKSEVLSGTIRRWTSNEDHEINQK